MMDPDECDEFSVVQWLPDGTHEYLARYVSLARAGELAFSYSDPKRPAVMMGVIRRVIITDGGDHTVFDWRNGPGIVWPARDSDGKFVADGPQPPPWNE